MTKKGLSNLMVRCVDHALSSKRVAPECSVPFSSMVSTALRAPGGERAQRAVWGRGTLHHPPLRPGARTSIQGAQRKVCPVVHWGTRSLQHFLDSKNRTMKNKQNCQLGVYHFKIFIREPRDSQLESSLCRSKNMIVQHRIWAQTPFSPLTVSPRGDEYTSWILGFLNRKIKLHDLITQGHYGTSRVCEKPQSV